MKITLFLILPILLSYVAHGQGPAGLPAAPKRPVTDTYFGKTVVDNYR